MYQIAGLCVCVCVCRPTSLDAFVFGFVAPVYKASLPSSPLQSHLRQLDNLTSFCDSILAIYFSTDHPCKIAAHTGNTHTLGASAWWNPHTSFTLHTLQTQAHKATNLTNHQHFPSSHVCFTACLLFVSALFLGAAHRLNTFPLCCLPLWVSPYIISLQVLPHLFRKQWMPTSRN